MRSPEGSMPQLYSSFPESLERKIGRNPKKTMAGFVAGVVFLSPFTQKIIAEEVMERCDDPSVSQIRTIDNMMNDRGGQKVNRLETGAEKQVYKNRLQVAEQNDVTVLNYFKYVKKLKKDFYSIEGPQMRFKDYFNPAKKFLHSLGVKLEMGIESKEYSYGGGPLRPEDTEKIEVKHQMIDLIEGFGKLPVEFIRDTGIKKVTLIKITEGNIAGYASSSESMYVDPVKAPPGVFIHELTHIWDARQCDNLYNDRGFAALNPSDIYVHPVAYADREKFISSYAEKTWQMSQATSEHDGARVRTLQKELAALSKKVVVKEEYGYTNIVEDKATLGEDVLNPDQHYLYREFKVPVLRKKFNFLLGRIYDDNPNVAKYIIESGKI